MISRFPNETKIWTEEELAALPDDGYNVEVVDGRLVMSPKNNSEHGEVCARIFVPLGTYVGKHRLGVVWDSSTGFWMQNRNCRAPDVSFISKARLKGLRRPLKKFFEGAPDLAIEVLAPSNTKVEIRSRLEDFFASGTRIAWIVDPDRKTVDVYHSASRKKQLELSDTLDGEDVVPGFRLAIAELFEEWTW